MKFILQYSKLNRMTTFWICFSKKSKKFACGGLLTKTLIPRNLELLYVGSNWPYKTSPWWQAPKTAVKHTGLYWNFLENFCFKENKNTLNILEYTGEKNLGTGILVNVLENILDYTGIFLKKTSGHPVYCFPLTLSFSYEGRRKFEFLIKMCLKLPFLAYFYPF